MKLLKQNIGETLLDSKMTIDNNKVYSKKLAEGILNAFTIRK
jgi:hypothetical protein